MTIVIYIKGIIIGYHRNRVYRQKWKTDRLAQQGVTAELPEAQQRSTLVSCHCSTLYAVDCQTANQSKSETSSAQQGSTLHLTTNTIIHYGCDFIYRSDLHFLVFNQS